MFSVAFVLVLVLVIGTWVIIEVKRFKHKIFAILLIVAILFTYFSFFMAVKGQDLDFKTVDGIKGAGTMYVMWLGNAFSNFRVVTSNAIDMNWKVNESMKSSDTFGS